MAAWLLELVFYVALAFPSVRRKLADLAPAVCALALTLSAPLSYLLYAPATGCFQATAPVVIVITAAAVCFWYVMLPRRRLTDLGFLAFVAAVAIVKLWRTVYARPLEGLPMEALGHLMWIRLGILSALVLRRVEGVGFGWWPTAREWSIGTRQFLLFVPPGAALGWLTGFAQWDPKPLAGMADIARLAATFLGMLWVVALSEEFFFRGLLQGWLTEWLADARRALLLSSALFGLAHLPFRGFPNWRFALLAAVAGYFYGRAFQQAGGIRAAMVAHAFTNTLWRWLLV